MVLITWKSHGLNRKKDTGNVSQNAGGTVDNIMPDTGYTETPNMPIPASVQA